MHVSISCANHQVRYHKPKKAKLPLNDTQDIVSRSLKSSSDLQVTSKTALEQAKVLKDPQQPQATNKTRELTQTAKKTDRVYRRPKKLAHLRHTKEFGLTYSQHGRVIPLVVTTILSTTSIFEFLTKDITLDERGTVFQSCFKRDVVMPFFQAPQEFDKEKLFAVLATLDNFPTPASNNFPYIPSKCFLAPEQALRSLLGRLGAKAQLMNLGEFLFGENIDTRDLSPLFFINFYVYKDIASVIPIPSSEVGHFEDCGTTEQFIQSLCENKALNTTYICLSKEEDSTQVEPSLKVVLGAKKYRLKSLITSNDRVGVSAYFFEGQKVYEHGYFRGHTKESNRLKHIKGLYQELADGKDKTPSQTAKTLNKDARLYIYEEIPSRKK